MASLYVEYLAVIKIMFIEIFRIKDVHDTAVPVNAENSVNCIKCPCVCVSVYFLTSEILFLQ